MLEHELIYQELEHPQIQYNIKVYDKHYKPNIVDENLSYTHLNIVLDYLSTDIVTMYENNIKLHFV